MNDRPSVLLVDDARDMLELLRRNMAAMGLTPFAANNVVDAIEVFMAFSKWIEYRSTIDPDVTPELVKAINKYQDLYITEQMGIK